MVIQEGEIKGSLHIEWAKFQGAKPFSPGEIALCARLEKAVRTKKILEEIEAISKEGTGTDVQRVLHIWKLFCVIALLMGARERFVNEATQSAREGGLEKIALKYQGFLPIDFTPPEHIHLWYVGELPDIVKIKRESRESSAKFLSQLETSRDIYQSSPKAVLTNEEFFQGLEKHTPEEVEKILSQEWETTKKRWIDLCFLFDRVNQSLDADGQLSHLYKKAISLYDEAIKNTVGFNTLDRPPTYEEFRSLKVPVFRHTDELLQRSETDDLFGILRQGDFEEAILKIVSCMLEEKDPEVERYVSEMLGLKSERKKGTPSASTSSESSEGSLGYLDGICPITVRRPAAKQKKKTEDEKSLEQAMQKLQITDPLPDISEVSIPVANQAEARITYDGSQGKLVPREALASSFTTVEKPAQFRCCYNAMPISLDERVQKQYSENLLLLDENAKESVLYHTYPIFLTRVIMALCEGTPWQSPSSSKTNTLYACIGSIHRYREEKEPVIGHFTDCFDDKRLYHHFFKPVHFGELISLFSSHHPIIDMARERAGSPRKKGESMVVRESGKQVTFKIHAEEYSLTLDDRVNGISYTIAFSKSLPKV